MSENKNSNTRHEIVMSNPDMDVRFYLSKDEGSYVTPHWHNSLEIVYVMKGKVTINLPFGKSVTANEDELFLANPREIHSVLSEKNEALVLQIPQQFYDKFVPSMSLRRFSVDMHPENDIERTKLERLKKLFIAMYIAYEVQPEGYLLRFNSLLYELLFTLVHSYSEKILQKDLDKSNKYFNILRQLMQFVDENHSKTISVSDLSQEFSYNPDYLSRLFKKYLNCTVTDYIYHVRMGYVYRELVGTNLQIGTILERHGCTNHSLAMKFFKEQWGDSPKEIRKKYRKSN